MEIHISVEERMKAQDRWAYDKKAHNSYMSSSVDEWYSKVAIMANTSDQIQSTALSAWYIYIP